MMGNKLVKYVTAAEKRTAMMDTLTDNLFSDMQQLMLESIKRTLSGKKDAILKSAERIYTAEYWNALEKKMTGKTNSLLDKFFTIFKKEIDELKAIYPENTFKMSVLDTNFEIIQKFLKEEINLLDFAEVSKADVLGYARMAQAKIALAEVDDLILKNIESSLGRALNNSKVNTKLFQDSYYQAIRNNLFKSVVTKKAKKYMYVGVIDKNNRDFCRKHAGKIRTKTEWQAIDNGQVGNAWDYQGGYNCRHMLLLVTESWNDKEVEEAKEVFTFTEAKVS